MKKILFTIMMLVRPTMRLAKNPAVNQVIPNRDYVIKVEDATIKGMGGKVVVALKLRQYRMYLRVSLWCLSPNWLTR